jgi:hypothetical protein
MLPLYGSLSPLAARFRGGVTPWYLAGGVAAANCVAAYQPIGAANLAASYVNLANPGTYNAAPGVAPAWNTTDGWIGNASGYLETGIIPSSNTWSMIARYKNGSAVALNFQTCIGQINGAANRCYLVQQSGAGFAYGNGGNLFYAPATTSGVMALAAQNAYLDGINVGTIPSGSATFLELYILARNSSGAPDLLSTQLHVQAIAIYNITLSAAQVAAITSAMQAL